MKIPFAITVSCLVLYSFAGAQVTYRFLTFENPGASVTLVFGLNDHGDLVGADNTIAGRHAFLVNKHEYVSLDGSGILETHTSFARGVNDFGDVVGAYLDDDGNEHGFLLKKDTLTTIDVPYPGSVGTQLNAISNTGI